MPGPGRRWGAGPRRADLGQPTASRVRFTRPVPAPDDAVGALLDVSAKVTELLDDRRARVELTATCAGDKVLGMARVLVQLS